MSCLLSSSVQLDCRENLGGISSIYLGSTTGYDITLDDAGDGAISGFTFGTGTSVTALTGLTTAPMYEFQQPRQAASFTEAGTFDEANGIAFYESTLTLVINKLSAANLNALDVLGKNTKLVAVFKDNNSNLFMVGNETGAIVTASTGDTGTAFSDGNRITITLTGFSRNPAKQIVFA